MTRVLGVLWWPALLTAAALVRLPRPAAFWYDESFTQWLARLPFALAVEATRGDVHPPLFYAAEWLIMRIPGATDTALRLIPALCSLLALILAKRIADRLRLTTAAQVAALVIMALAGWQIYYSQEARSYSLIMALYLAGAVAVLERRWWWLWAAFAGLLLTHNYGVIYCAVLGAWALIQELRLPVHSSTLEPESRWGNVLAAGLGALLIYAPWFFYATLAQLGEFRDHWIWPPTPADVIVTFAYDILGQLTNSMWAAVAVVSAIALTIFVLWRAFSERDAPRLLAYLTLAPVVVAVLLSYAFEPLYLYRALIGSAPPFYLLIGWALTHRVSVNARAWAAAVLIPPIAVSSALDGMRTTSAQRYGAEAVSAYIAERWEPGDVIYHLNLYSLVEMSQYTAERPAYLLPIAGDGLHVGGLTRRTREAMGIAGHEAELADIAWGRAWLVVIDGPDLDQTPQRDEVLADWPGALALRLTTDAQKYHTVELWLIERSQNE